MSKRTREQILQDNVKKLELEREYRINRYVIPIEIKLDKAREKLRKYKNK